MELPVLLTGGLGYIGSHTAVQLIQAGYRVHIIDNLSSSDIRVLDRLRDITKTDIPFTELDILDSERLSAFLGSHAFSAVVHFAALKSVGESVTQPLKYYTNNVSGTVNFLEMYRKYPANAKNVVFSSSATVYRAATAPLTEDAALGASNPYGRTKRMMEEVFEDLCVSDPSWKATILRYFNPIGAHSSGLIGEDPQGIPNNLLPFIQQVAVGRLPRLNIFGDDYPESPDGTGVRDYIHVVDLADAHVQAINQLLRSSDTGAANYRVYNLGTGTGYSVRQMVAAFEAASGKAIACAVGGRRPGDLGSVVCCPDKAHKELGWTAKYGLTEMMRDAWNWQHNNPYGYKGTPN